MCDVPVLRFPEFTDEWKEERLDEIVELSKGVGISKEQLSEDGEPCILYGELYTKYKSEIIRKVISKTNIESSNLKRSKRNDVIIPCSGETAIDIAVARCIPFDNILLGGDLNIIRLHKDDGAFMAYQLNGKRKIDIAKLAQGVSVVHLYGENLKSIKTYNPCLQEQQKIVKLLSMLDERIEVQNKVIDKLKSLIKGIRQNVFAQNICETYPLGHFLTEYSERNHSASRFVASVGKYGIWLRDDIYSKSLSADYSMNKVIRKNTLTIGMGSTQIDIGILTDDVEYCISLAYSTFYINGINTSYLREYLIWLNSILSAKYMITSVRQGKSVNKDELLNHPLAICDDKHQAIVAARFNMLRQKIGTETVVLNMLIKQRQYLLSTMFI